MPLYVYKCLQGHRFERIQTIQEMELGATKCECGVAASVVIVPTQIAPMFTPYRCPITDKPIMTKTAHTENLKRHGCRVYEPGETDQFLRKKAEEDRSLDRKVEESVDRFVDGLSGDERSQLENEVASGMDVTFERKTV